MATDIDHVVNRRGPAEHFPARHRHSSAVEAKAGLAGIACIHPIRFRVELHRRARHGHRRYLGRSVAGLDQSHSARGIFGEARCDHSPGRTTADYHKIECSRHAALRSCCSSLTLPGRTLGTIETVAARRRAGKPWMVVTLAERAASATIGLAADCSCTLWRLTGTWMTRSRCRRPLRTKRSGISFATWSRPTSP